MGVVVNLSEARAIKQLKKTNESLEEMAYKYLSLDMISPEASMAYQVEIYEMYGLETLQLVNEKLPEIKKKLGLS